MDRRRALTRPQLMQRIGQPIKVIDLWSGRNYEKIFQGDLRGYHCTWIAFDVEGVDENAALPGKLSDV